MLLLPVSNLVHLALAAADRLAAEGVSAAVINPRFFRPLDSDLITNWATSTGRVVTVKDNCALGGFDNGVLQLLHQQDLHLPAMILGHPDHFVDQGPQTTLWAKAGIDAEGIVRSSMALLKSDNADLAT